MKLVRDPEKAVQPVIGSHKENMKDKERNWKGMIERK
jgi:hypothetical protein